MYISCCASASLCQLVAECGFDRVVLSASELERSSQEQIQGLSRTLNHFHLTCRSLNDFCPPELKLCGPEYKLGQVEQYVSNLAPRTAAGMHVPCCRDLQAVSDSNFDGAHLQPDDKCT